MKSITVLILFSLLFFANCQPKSQAKNPKKMTENTPKLRHVVLFKFKKEISEPQKTAIQNAFGDFVKQVPELVKDYEFGLNNSPEGLDQGLTHCFLVTFASEKDRDAYIPNALHQTFVKNFLSETVEKVTVVDYWAK
jgi:Stress responsive A/B Barrel Domain